jgi:hypothetical protein
MLARRATATGGLKRRLKFWLLAFQGALAQRPAAEVVERSSAGVLARSRNNLLTFGRAYPNVTGGPFCARLVALCTCHVHNRALLVHETNAHLNFGTSSSNPPFLLCFFTSTLHIRQLSAKPVLSAAAAQPSPSPTEHTHCDRPIAPTPRALRAPGI